MKLSLLTLCALFTTLYAVPNAHAADPVGILSDAHSSISILRKDEKTVMDLNKDDPVYLGDTVLTDDGDHAVLEFVDQTTISINGKDGQLYIDRFVYDPDNPANNESEFSIWRATFEYTSGLVSKGGSQSKINIDFGSIGIRGTHILRTMEDGECWIYLEDGEIDVFNEAGTVSLKPGDGTRLSSKTVDPAPVKPWSQEKIEWIKGTVKPPSEAE